MEQEAGEDARRIEIQRRLTEIDSEAVRLIPWSDVRRRLESCLNALTSPKNVREA